MAWAVEQFALLLNLLWFLWPGVMLGVRLRHPSFPWWAVAALALAVGYGLLLAPLELQDQWLHWQVAHASGPPPQELVDALVRDSGAVVMRAFWWLPQGLLWALWLAAYGVVQGVMRWRRAVRG